MRERRKVFREGGGVEVLLLRDRLALGRFRKTRPRAAEKRELLLDLWLRVIERREESDYLPLGPRRRRLGLP